MTYMDICFPWEDLGDNISHQKRYLIAREKLQELTELKQELDRLVSGVPAVGLIEKHWLEHHHRIRGPARNRAATRLAAWWKAVPSQRAYKAFCRARKANRAAVTLQRFWRRELNRRRAALQRELAEHAAIVSRVQALWRGRVARRKVGKLRQEAAERSADLRAAMFIQAAYKRNREKRRTLVEGIAAMKVAQVWRSFLARRKLQRQMSAEYIQLYWRNLQRRKVTRENRAATTIQSIRRGNLVRRENARQKELIIRLQTRRRGTVARRVAEDLRQAAARDSRVVHATTFIQAIFKGNRARQNFLFEKMMVTRVQQQWRRFIKRRRVEKRAAIMIQRNWRAYKCRKILSSAKRERASIIIQCLWRGSKARKEIGKHREHLVRVQALWRGALARREVNELREAIVLEDRVINAMTFIQAMYKGNAQRRKYLWEKMMVTRVQRTWRRFVWQRKLRRASATKTIQLYWRWRKAALRGEEGRRRAAIALQTSIRTALWRRKLREPEVECFNRRSVEYAARCLPPRNAGSAWADYVMISHVEGVEAATLRYPLNEWGLTRDGVLLNGLDPRTTPFTRIIVQVKRFKSETITINRMVLAARVIQRWWRSTATNEKSWMETTAGIFTIEGGTSWLDNIRQYATMEMTRR